MDQYKEEGPPPIASYLKNDNKGLVNYVPQFGGETRPGYPDNTRKNEDNKSEFHKIREEIPGENVLMDQDPPTGEGANDDRFVAQDEFNTDNDRLPMAGNSENLDNIDVGPSNMQNNSLLHRMRNKRKIRGINII